ncbi:MAG TPA: hypothetical protein GXX26_06850 [Clostridiaceae bacterium]|nr:hypothetical protein [Clostridiaceae bacterium]
MPEVQLNAGVELLWYPKYQFLNIKLIDGHKHMKNTACPKRNFHQERMIHAVNETVYIMGEPELTAEQMRKFLRSVNPNAPQGIEEIYLEEGKTEGVRGDIAFCQAIHETNYFRFTGVARIEWHNPAGLGVTGQIVNGVPVGCKFPDWRIGIRAHIQHLKAYAVKNPTFSNPLVDPRFDVLKQAGYIGTAPTWTDLNGKWAYPGKTYGQSILAIYDKVKTIKVDTDSEKVKQLTQEIEALRKEISRLNAIISQIRILVS